jgi:protein involved in polysaccharide export with SLBB domain
MMAQLGTATLTLNLVAMRVLLLALSLSLLPATIAAQSAPMAGAQRAARSELAARLQHLESLIASAGKADQRSKLQAEQTAIRARLENGDFKVGDRFVMTVRFDSVRVDTASVRDSLVVSILNLPDLRLQGVLRSELDEKLNQHVARFIRNASVRSNVLTRIAVLGAVRAPGFYYASPDRPVSDILMLAGGPAPEANLGRFELRRGTTTLVEGKASRELLESGRTLEQLDVQSGDEFRIPVKRKVNWQLVIQLFFIASSLFFAVFQFLQWYYNRQDDI